jgi:hypothetical protein
LIVGYAGLIITVTGECLMSIQNTLATNDAELHVDINCCIVWRTPPKDTEERMLRGQTNTALAKIAHDLQESVGHTILAVVKIKSE